MKRLLMCGLFVVLAVGAHTAEAQNAKKIEELKYAMKPLKLRSDGGMGVGEKAGAVTPVPSLRSKAALPLMTASDPVRLSLKIDPKALSMESVRT